MNQLASIYSAFIDCTTGRIVQENSFPLDSILVENINLWTGEHGWLLSWTGYPFPATQAIETNYLCEVNLNAPLKFAPSVLEDSSTEDEMFAMGPIIFANASDKGIFLAYLKLSIDSVEPSLVCLGQIPRESDLKQVKEYIIEVGLKSSVLFQNNASYFVVIDADWKVTEWVKAGKPGLEVICPETSGLWLSELNALQEKSSSKIIHGSFRGNPFWRIKVNGAKSLMTKSDWTHWLDVSVPAHTHPYGHFEEDVIVGSVIISGPHWKLSQQEEQQTIIIAVGVIKKEAIGLPEEQARSLRGGELICLSQDGQLVQACKEEIVEQVELCLVGNTVIGIDRIQRRWRLWRWEPLAGKKQFTTVRWLDEEVVHAHVVTNHENSDPEGMYFWLVEERPKGLAVSRRDGQTLEEIEDPITLTGWSLPYALDRSVGEWDWPIKKGIIGYQDALLLIAADEKNRMVLYRVEADTEEQ